MFQSNKTALSYSCTYVSTYFGVALPSPGESMNALLYLKKHPLRNVQIIKSKVLNNESA